MENTYPRAFLILAARGDYRQPIDLNAIPADDDPDKGYKLLFHTDTLIQNRLNAILFTESLILAATASLGENGLVVKAIAFPALIFTIARWHGLSPLERSYSWMANAGCNASHTGFYRERGEGKDKGLSRFKGSVWTRPYIDLNPATRKRRLRWLTRKR